MIDLRALGILVVSLKAEQEGSASLRYGLIGYPLLLWLTLKGLDQTRVLHPKAGES